MSVELPGVGEVRARSGTSTMELAGAVKVWHDKYLVARKGGLKDGVIVGASIILLLDVLTLGVYFLIR